MLCCFLALVIFFLKNFISVLVLVLVLIRMELSYVAVDYFFQLSVILIDYIHAGVMYWMTGNFCVVAK